MPQFKYVAVTAEGAKVTGLLEAPTAVGAESALGSQFHKVVKVKEKKALLQIELTTKKVPREEVMNFSRQLAAFVRAGIPILDAIETIGSEVANDTLKKTLDEIVDALRRGDTFSGAVGLQSKVFPRFYVDMLRAAELTGRLDTVLDQLSKYIERDLEARRKIKSALSYPIIISIMSVITVIILTTFVLPRFKKFFASLNAKLPLATRILLGGANFLGQWWWAILALIISASVFLVWFTKQPRGKLWKDSFKLKIPVVGDVVKFAIVERFCRILSSMVSAGVPLPEAMTVVSEGTKNVVYETALTGVREEMLQGEGIASPMTRTALFPAAVTQMVKVGESTGTLDQQLETAASFYAQELDYKLKKLTSMFEPAVIVLMGLVVGFVAVALISAMYGIFSQVGGVK
ncbi:MAG: type II secretion system F family protein [Actinomycetota bacterium]|nr:type II secretion system F family protein [Actinomycetota bacterium]